MGRVLPGLRRRDSHLQPRSRAGRDPGGHERADRELGMDRPRLSFLARGEDTMNVRRKGVLATLIVASLSFGLEWPGDGAVRRMLFWHNPFPIYDATYVFKVFPRKKVVPTNSPTGYYTTFFWGNDGAFAWDGG